MKCKMIFLKTNKADILSYYVNIFYVIKMLNKCKHNYNHNTLDIETNC